MRQPSVSDEVKEILELSDKPLSVREIVRVLGDKYDSNQVSASIRYWVKRGEIQATRKLGYRKYNVYSLK